MEGKIELKQYDGSQILPKDDAILYDMLTGGQCGIIKGCELTWLGSNQVHISSGYGIIKGRLFEVAEQTIYAKLPISTSSNFGYVYISVTLNSDTPIRIDTCVSATAYIEGDWKEDEDINIINGCWEMPLAEYKATSSGITEFIDMSVKVTSPVVTLTDFSEWGAIKKTGYMVDAILSKKQILTFENKLIAPQQWGVSKDYEGYPYKTFVNCIGVDLNYVPYVTFNISDALSGTFAPIATTAVNGVYIYANSIPENNIIIPTIQCIRKVG